MASRACNRFAALSFLVMVLSFPSCEYNLKEVGQPTFDDNYSRDPLEGLSVLEPIYILHVKIIVVSFVAGVVFLLVAFVIRENEKPVDDGAANQSLEQTCTNSDTEG